MFDRFFTKKWLKLTLQKIRPESSFPFCFQKKRRFQVFYQARQNLNLALECATNTFGSSLVAAIKLDVGRQGWHRRMR